MIFEQKFDELRQSYTFSNSNGILKISYFNYTFVVGI